MAIERKPFKIIFQGDTAVEMQIEDPFLYLSKDALTGMALGRLQQGGKIFSTEINGKEIEEKVLLDSGKVSGAVWLFPDHQAGYARNVAHKMQTALRLRLV